MPPKFKFAKGEVVNTAFAIIREHGWKKLTTRAVAERLGSSARPIYSFFNSMEEMDDLLIQKTVGLLFSYMIEKRTDDPWHDHGIGYVLFAMDEKNLFQGITDGKRVDCYKKQSDFIWDTLTRSLASYPPFQGLSPEQISRIQLTRWIFAHGLACQVNRASNGVWNKGSVIAIMQQGSDAICSGLKAQYTLGRQPAPI